MTALEFARRWNDQRKWFMEELANESSEWVSTQQLNKLGLSPEQRAAAMELIDGVIVDVMYSSLLHLDGSADFGGDQQLYKLFDQSGNLINPCGDIEAAAYEVFHGTDSEDPIQ